MTGALPPRSVAPTWSTPERYTRLPSTPTRTGTVGPRTIQYRCGNRRSLAGCRGAHRFRVDYAVGACGRLVLCPFRTLRCGALAAFPRRGRHLRVDAARVRGLARLPLRLVLLAEQPVLLPESAVGRRGDGGERAGLRGEPHLLCVDLAHDPLDRVDYQHRRPRHRQVD